MSNIPEPKKYGSMSQRRKKQYQPVLVYHSAEKMQNAIKSFPALLSHGNQSGQKRKSNSPPGRPEENAVNQSSQEQKPQRTQPKLTRWTNFTSTSTTSTTTTSSSRKESTPQSVGPSAKNHHPCQKAKQTPIWDPKQTAFRVLENVASFTVIRLQLNVLYIICFQFYVMSLVMNQVNSSSKDYDTLSYPISQSEAAAYQKGGHDGELDWRLWWCWQRNLICPPATLVSQIASFVMSVRLLTVYCLPLLKATPRREVELCWTQ